MTKLVSGVASETSIRRLDLRENSKRRPAGHVSQRAHERIPCWSVMMNHLAERNQRRERIADHRQAHRAEPLTRQCAELKGQGANLAPRFGASSESSRQRARHQDRDRKCAVVAITSCDRSSDGLRSIPPPRVGDNLPRGSLFADIFGLLPPRRTPPSKVPSCSDC